MGRLWGQTVLTSSPHPHRASQVELVVMNPPANTGAIRDTGSIPGLGISPGYFWSRKWQLTPVLLPGKPHGQRSLAGHGPQDRRELDTTEVTKHACIKNDTNKLSCKTERESET